MIPFDWGPISKEGKELLTQEIFIAMVYETFDKVKEGDIVVDFGATTGDFVYSILHKKPLHVYALEPSKLVFPFLVKNTRGFPVTAINQAIANQDADVICPGICHSDTKIVPGITFKTLIELYSLDRIDFIKTDCEGGEYSIFTNDNMDFLLNKVGTIAGEWHLSNPYLKKEFRNFRDNFLPHFKYEIRDISNQCDIKSGLYSDAFLEYYTEVFVFIRGKQ